MATKNETIQAVSNLFNLDEADGSTLANILGGYRFSSTKDGATLTAVNREDGAIILGQNNRTDRAVRAFLILGAMVSKVDGSVTITGDRVLRRDGTQVFKGDRVLGDYPIGHKVDGRQTVGMRLTDWSEVNRAKNGGRVVRFPIPESAEGTADSTGDDDGGSEDSAAEDSETVV